MSPPITLTPPPIFHLDSAGVDVKPHPILGMDLRTLGFVEVEVDSHGWLGF